MSSACSAPRTDSFFPLPFPLWNIFFINDLWNHTEEMLPLEAGSPSPPWVRIVIWVMLLLAGVRWLWLWHFHSHLRSSVWTCKQMHGNRNCRKLQMPRLLFTCWAKWLMSLQCCHLPIPKNVFEVFTPKNSSYLRAAIYDKCLYDFFYYTSFPSICLPLRSWNSKEAPPQTPAT